ncbi:hypothetical protein AB6A40_010520 [Gnathostoma spinigerum]|uniref:Uncharacterized protein n=1 Tax=Gnathostoma spinigerum TaxID=75299 RepID=A0ABD6EV98_9BILA
MTKNVRKCWFFFQYAAWFCDQPWHFFELKCVAINDDHSKVEIEYPSATELQQARVEALRQIPETKRKAKREADDLSEELEKDSMEERCNSGEKEFHSSCEGGKGQIKGDSGSEKSCTDGEMDTMED